MTKRCFRALPLNQEEPTDRRKEKIVDQRPKPTIKHVARLAGVSVATVSRVTSGLTVVSESTKRRVEEAIASVGYKSNLAAVDMSSLASKARRLIRNQNKQRS
jgi:hypothetical protein